ncbi:hypothetical protein [Arthrobacter cheniae]|uniref:hypothetical protein n=1 Tax=Arthrobacter cheniae TaxID=1258888 RepID=UPI0016034845|nr:hypothetical protein [Arthrobacter cheniae]
MRLYTAWSISLTILAVAPSFFLGLALAIAGTIDPMYPAMILVGPDASVRPDAHS